MAAPRTVTRKVSEDQVAGDGAVEEAGPPPRVGVAGRHHVDVGGEHERGPVPGAGQPGDDAVGRAPGGRAVDLDARGAGVAGEVRDSRVPLVDVQAVGPQGVRQGVLELVLDGRPGHARHPDQVGDQ